MTKRVGGFPLRQAEMLVAIVATLYLSLLHVLRVPQAGGLWRDEVVSYNVADMPSLREIGAWTKWSSFPVLLSAPLRVWIKLGLAHSDFGLRVFGCLIGLGLIGAFWLATRSLGGGTPLCALTLFGFNAWALIYGDSLRAYGLGMILMLLSFVEVGRMAGGAVSRRRLLLAAAASVLSVQCLFQNAFFLLSFCLAAAGLALRRSRPKDAAAVLLVGLLAAVSLLPYASSARDWLPVWMAHPVTSHWAVFYEALAFPRSAPWAWAGLFAAASAVAVRFVRQPSSSERGDAALYAALSLACACLVFAAFIQITHKPGQPWYYLSLMALMACVFDVLLGSGEIPALRLGRLALAFFWIGAVSKPVWIASSQRLTNIDLVAARLNKEVAAEDIVVLTRWFYTPAFERYYRGSAPWTTLPPLSDHRLQRLDLVLRQAQLERPLEPVLEQVSAVLRSGHRAWIVGGAPIGQRLDDVADLPPAPSDLSRTDYEVYVSHWFRQFGAFLAKRAVTIQLLSLPTPGVSPYENLFIQVAQGWKERDPRAAGKPWRAFGRAVILK